MAREQFLLKFQHDSSVKNQDCQTQRALSLDPDHFANQPGAGRQDGCVGRRARRCHLRQCSIPRADAPLTNVTMSGDR